MTGQTVERVVVTTVQNTLAGRYLLGSRIATGGMATVWRARDELLGRDVAIKVLSDELSHDPSAAERFRREARTAASMSHPNMANVFDLVEENGRPGIVMEFIENETLAERLAAERQLPVAEAIRIAEQTLDALDAAHRCGVVHRDVKPGNILLTPDGGVKVADFGIARSLGEASITQTGAIIGTAGYASPEHVRGEPATPRSDLYSMGIVLYEMLTGVRPFKGDTPVSVALARLSNDPAPPSAHRPSIPRALDDAVLRSLARHPAARFASANEMRAALAPAGTTTQILQLEGAGDDDTVVLGSSGRPVSDARRAWLPDPARRALRLIVWPMLLLGIVAVAIAGATSRSTLAPRPSSSASAPPACCLVPNLIGLPLDLGIERLRHAGFRLGDAILVDSTEPDGVIIDQSVRAGARLERNSTIDLTWSNQVEPTPTPSHRGKGKRGHGD